MRRTILLYPFLVGGIISACAGEGGPPIDAPSINGSDGGTPFVHDSSPPQEAAAEVSSEVSVVCEPESNATFCSRFGLVCGNVSAIDNCTQPRTSDCGGCPNGLFCFAGSCRTAENPVCTSFTYTDYGPCQPNNTRTRAITSSFPAGCLNGNPVLQEGCLYVPPVVPCTDFVYTPYGACQSNSTQSRSVVSSAPVGCTGGSPVLVQACVYVPPPPPECTSFTYSPYGECQANNTRTRTVTSASPVGCAGGTPILSEVCKRCSFIRLNSPTSRASAPQTSEWNLGSGGYTFEMWIRVPPGTASGRVWVTNENYQVCNLGIVYDQGKIGFGSYDEGTCVPSSQTFLNITSSQINDNQWHHLALVRFANAARLYVNGNQEGQVAVGTGLNLKGSLAFGNPSGYPDHFAAQGINIGPVRMSVGSRYAGNFVPMTSWTVDGNTIGQWMSLSNPVGNVIQDESFAADNNFVIFKDIVVETDSSLCR